MKKAVPPRLHVILARESRTAIVFRRGPSKHACTFLWDRQDDSFKLGQWLKGRIYEKRADLSPNGEHVIYFAMNGKWSSSSKGSWTAVSRTPWLKALDFFPKGDCWEGGGLFISNSRYWLNDRYFDQNESFIDSGSFTREYTTEQSESRFGAECLGVYFNRLMRDGWLLTNETQSGASHSTTTFDKPISQFWTLRKISHAQLGADEGKGVYWDEHELRNCSQDIFVPQPKWEWADIDRGCVVFAESGNIFRSTIDISRGIDSRTLLHDFKNYSFEDLEAPY